MTHSKWHILVVEDDPDGQEVVAAILQHLNLSIEVVSNSAEAEALLFRSGSTYQAAIIDLALPDKDGWELLSEIRSNPQTAELPCIAVTAHHTSKVREQALISGFNAYFAKPLDSTNFARGLEAVLS